MDLLQALSELPKLVEDYKRVSAELADAQRELAAVHSDKYVSIKWIAQHWDVSDDTAHDMLKALSTGRKGQTEIKVLTYGSKVVRYRKSDIEKITEANLLPLKDMLAQKRALKAVRG